MFVTILVSKILISRPGARVLCLGHQWRIILCPSHLGAHVWSCLHFYYSYVFQKNTHQAVCMDTVFIQSSFVFCIVFSVRHWSRAMACCFKNIRIYILSESGQVSGSWIHTIVVEEAGRSFLSAEACGRACSHPWGPGVRSRDTPAAVITIKSCP